MKRHQFVTATAALTLVAAGAAASPSTAQSAESARAPQVKTLAKGLVSPLSIAIAKNGTRYISTNFTGGLYRQRPGGQPVPVYQSKDGAEAGAVSTRNGVVSFATSGKTDFQLWRIAPGKSPVAVADLGKYEKRKNPDQAATYGFQGLDAACAALIPKELGPATYTGIVESHPYATTMTAKATYVADAAANAILAVSASGRISTVAVLPPVPVVITADAAKTNKIPDCAVGKTYNFEPVPTDVEVGAGGKLYVSTLPGGPEDGSTGANGGVSTINPRTGKVRSLVGGLLTPTGLGLSANGDIYVSQLFAGVISRIRSGSTTAKPYVKAPLPGDVEIVDGALYATTNVLPGGPKDPPAGKLVQVLP